MPYSTQEDLTVLIDDIKITYDWAFGPITFFGTGLNDMSIFASQPETDSDTSIPYVIKIRTSAAPDTFQVSIDNGAVFIGNYPITVGAGLAVGPAGVKIDFGASTGHTIGDYWKFTAIPESQTLIREIAYAWVNDNLERYHHTVPIPSPSKTVMLAEATYAIYLYLRASNDPRSAAFHQEAIRLITLLTTFKVAAKVPEEAGEELRLAEREADLRREKRHFARIAEVRTAGGAVGGR